MTILQFKESHGISSSVTRAGIKVKNSSFDALRETSQRENKKRPHSEASSSELSQDGLVSTQKD